MARGKSGRVVLEIDPEFKKELYLQLERKQKTMKEWFVGEAEALVYGDRQQDMFATASDKDTPSSKRKNKE